MTESPFQLRLRNTSLVLLATIATTASLYFASAFFAPLVLGVLISYAWWPVVSFLNRLYIPRAIGAALVVSLFVGGGWFAGVALQEQAVDLIDKVPSALRQVLRDESNGIEERPSVLSRLREAREEIEKATSEANGEGNGDERAVQSGESAVAVEEPVRVVVERGASPMMNYVLDGSLGFLVLVGQSLSVLLLVYFVLASGDLYKAKLIRVSGDSLSDKKLTLTILDDINRQLRRFLFVMLVGAVFVGLTTWLAFWWLGVEEAMLWGAIAGVASAVPYVGPVFVFAASGLTAFLQFGTLSDAALVAAVSLGITSLQGNILTPYLTSRAAHLNAVAIFVSLLFWGWLWGPVGLIVATPIQMIVKAVCDHIDELNPIGEFLG